MKSNQGAVSRSGNTAKLYGAADIVYTAYDSFGAVAAEYSFFPDKRVLYVRWHGHFSGHEVIRVAKVGLGLHKQLQPLGLVLDTRGTSGDWGDAASWLTYEWIPGIKANSLSLRGIAYVLDPDTEVTYDNAQVIALLNQQFDFRTFYTPGPAWRWLRQHTTSRLATPTAQ